jgi:NhaA family Na+:H+ antiporter
MSDSATQPTELPRRKTGSTPRPAALARPLREFLSTEAGSSVLLLGATLLALVWANSPLASAYEDLWALELSVDVGGAGITEDLRHWVNDGLMVFFFYVIGLEIRRELAMGELRNRREATVPAVAALAGMAVPALVFLAFNAGGEAARGWGIVMATDIAFVLGALALLGPRCPSQVRVFLLTLAIVDDIGAITVIAIFYTESIDLVALAAAGGVLAIIGLVRRLRVWRGPAYFVAGLALWVAMHESGVHPTIAGVLLGLLTAVFAPQRAAVERASALTRSFRQAPSPQLARSAMLGVNEAVSPNERLQEALHPYTSYVIVPLFALANAGVVLDGDALERALGSSLTLGVVAGLVLGKAAGISFASLLAVRLGAGELPRGVGRTQLAGAAALAGIGFTVSLFVTDLAFTDPALQAEAKVGILVASATAALLGWALFRLAARRGDGTEPARPTRLDPPVDLAHDHVRGPLDAPLTLVEYGDFECPFCGDATGSIQELRARLGDELRYVFRHLPLRERHPNAELAAEAVEAAGAQGRFWEMHDRLFAHQDRLEFDDLLGHAQALGLDVERIAEALTQRTYEPHIEVDLASAERSGVRGTPTFFVGEERHTGPYDAESLARALRASRPHPV